MNRLILPSLLAWLATCATGPAQVHIGYGPASRIARTADIPGRNVPGQCLPFARGLHARLQAAGFRSQIIEYSYACPWLPTAADAPCAALSHAVVAYEDEGRTYIADNQSWAPTWVPKASPVTMAQRFSGIQVAVRGARIMPTEDLRRPPQEMIGRRLYAGRSMPLLASH